MLVLVLGGLLLLAWLEWRAGCWRAAIELLPGRDVSSIRDSCYLGLRLRLRCASRRRVGARAGIVA